MNKAVVKLADRSFCRHMFIFLLNICVGVELLGYSVDVGYLL